MNTNAKGGAVSLDKSCGAELDGNEFLDIEANMGGAVSSIDSTVSVTGSKFKAIGQKFTYTTADYSPNLLNEFRG